MRMVERMARAMSEAQGAKWDDLTDCMKNLSGDDDEREFYLHLALAALRAMREPSAGMITAGAAWTEYQPEDAAPTTVDPDGLVPDADYNCARRVFQSMLSAAIREAEAE